MENVIELNKSFHFEEEDQFSFSIEEQKQANQAMADFYESLENGTIQPMKRRV